MEKEEIKEEEYKILEDEEDIRRKKIINFFNELAENAKKEEAREKEAGPLCGVISEMSFIKDSMGNHVMFFKQPTQNYAVNLEVQTTVVYANQGPKFDREFSYPSFQGIMMVHLLNNGVRSYNVENMVEVYKFLKSDIENGFNNKPNLDLLFRMNEKSKKVNVYADIKLGSRTVKEEVAFKNLPVYCKVLNDSFQRKGKDTKQDSEFGGK